VVDDLLAVGGVDFVEKAKDAVGDVVDKAKDAAGDVGDKVKDSDALKKVEDTVEERAAKGGTLGTAADKADHVIDTVQGTED